MGASHLGINLSVVRGTIAADPVRRELPSGGVAVQFDVAVAQSSSGRVPVSWQDPPSGRDGELSAGTAVLVVGEVHRRFFRVGGATQSRTEVLVHELVPGRRPAAARRALARAAEQLGAA
jgi:single-strand DNA-binding protein